LRIELRFTTINDEVLYADGPIVKLGESEIDFLKQRAAANRRKRIRLCAHRDVQDPLHEMIIVLRNDSYIRPHRHVEKAESFHIVEGQVDVVIFDRAGKITEVVQMGDYRSGHKFFYRLSVPDFHTLLIRSDYVVFHETTNGPFDSARSIYAEWAPDDADKAAVSVFTSNLAEEVRVFLHHHSPLTANGRTLR